MRRLRLPQQVFHPHARTLWTQQVRFHSSSCSDSATKSSQYRLHCSCSGCVFVPVTPGSTTPSASFGIFKDSVISWFCVVAAISASYLIFLSSSAQRPSNLLVSPDLDLSSLRLFLFSFVFIYILSRCAFCEISFFGAVHRVECCEILYHQPLLHPVSSLVSLVECVRSNTDTFNSLSWSQFGIELSSHNFHVLLFGIRVFLN